MNSPFPGMDPYLEQWWRDVHHRLCTYSCDHLQTQLGTGLRARVDERLVVEVDEHGRSIYPDVRIVERATSWESDVQPVGGLAVAEPLRVKIASEPVRQAFIQIIDIQHGGQVVTVIEFLSPSNKLPGDGLEQYLRKQQECRQAGVNLVEIDLVRCGRRQTLARLSGSSRLNTTYQVCVYRASNKDECEVYPIALAAPLPAIHVPLRQTDPDAVLNLPVIVQQVYRNGAYGDDIEYGAPCDPPLQGEERVWADALLAKAGLRK